MRPHQSPDCKCAACREWDGPESEDGLDDAPELEPYHGPYVITSNMGGIAYKLPTDVTDWQIGEFVSIDPVTAKATRLAGIPFGICHGSGIDP